jgi:anti-anti-sigma factor
MGVRRSLRMGIRRIRPSGPPGHGRRRRYPARVPINEWSDSIQVAELQNDPSFAEDMGLLAVYYQRCADDRKAGRADARTRDAVLDMRHVQFLNSSNIAQLLRVRKLAHLAGAQVRICSVSDRIWGVLLATDLDRIFDFSEDVTTALAAVQMTRGK